MIKTYLIEKKGLELMEKIFPQEWINRLKDSKNDKIILIKIFHMKEKNSARRNSIHVDKKLNMNQ
jgi:CRISPR/Cas system-associated exonuclease Cas4 (RecB family)